MPIIQGETSIAANTTNDNLLSGSPFEFLPYDAHVEIGLSMETGGAVGDLIADVFSGSDILATGFKIPNLGNLKVNEAMFLEDEALAGERLVVRVRNATSASARKCQFIVRVTAL